MKRNPALPGGKAAPSRKKPGAAGVSLPRRLPAVRKRRSILMASGRRFVRPSGPPEKKAFQACCGTPFLCGL